jgi:hypothetical protein
MNVETALFCMLAIRPTSLNEVIHRLPYAKKTIYNAVEKMVSTGDLIKQRDHDGRVIISMPHDSYHQRLKELYTTLMTQGIDPAPLVSKTCQEIWKQISTKKITADQIAKKIGYRTVTVRKYLHLLSHAKAVTIISKKPLSIKKNGSSELAHFLDDGTSDEKTNENTIYVAGTRPFEEQFLTPTELKQKIYDHPLQSMSITGTRFQLKGKGRHIIYESIPTDSDLEHLFISSLFTIDGVEERCLLILKSRKLNIAKLLSYAQKEKVVNIIGGYLQIIHDLSPSLVDTQTIDLFYQQVQEKTMVFLKQMKKYGKQGWEKPYETKWNLDIYLDLDAIKHGVRAI